MEFKRKFFKTQGNCKDFRDIKKLKALINFRKIIGQFCKSFEKF